MQTASRDLDIETISQCHATNIGPRRAAKKRIRSLTALKVFLRHLNRPIDNAMDISKTRETSKEGIGE